MTFPPTLKAGDRVAIVASAKRLQSGIDEAIALLEDWGLQVEVGDHVFDESNLFAGTDSDKGGKKKRGPGPGRNKTKDLAAAAAYRKRKADTMDQLTETQSKRQADLVSFLTAS